MVRRGLRGDGVGALGARRPGDPAAAEVILRGVQHLPRGTQLQRVRGDVIGVRVRAVRRGCARDLRVGSGATSRLGSGG